MWEPKKSTEARDRIGPVRYLHETLLHNYWASLSDQEQEKRKGSRACSEYMLKAALNSGGRISAYVPRGLRHGLHQLRLDNDHLCALPATQALLRENGKTGGTQMLYNENIVCPPRASDVVPVQDMRGAWGRCHRPDLADVLLW